MENSRAEEQNKSIQNGEQDQSSPERNTQQVTHNLDTGEDEPLRKPEDESIMDFGSGSGGGSAGDGAAA